MMLKLDELELELTHSWSHHGFGRRLNRRASFTLTDR